MKYHQRDFNEELKQKIKTIEQTLKDYAEELLSEYKPVFAKKKLKFDVGLDKNGEDPFQPGYLSSVSIGVTDETDESDELMDFHMIRIWECDRYFLGLLISKNIPGCKIIGELMDDSVEEIKTDLKEYIEEMLVDLI
jgi:hypothetical protein